MSHDKKAAGHEAADWIESSNSVYPLTKNWHGDSKHLLAFGIMIFMVA